ncbi:MAG: hypothetical protein ACI81R_001399 [Bradymonadia bacterium]|jgi:hypothetical protein
MNAATTTRTLTAALALCLVGFFAAPASAQAVEGAEAFIGTFMPHGLDGRDYVDTHLGELQAVLLDCYQLELVEDDSVAGMMVVRVHIAPNGSVSQVDVLDNRTGNTELAVCAQEEMEELQLTANDRPNVSITIPVSFLVDTRYATQGGTATRIASR